MNARNASDLKTATAAHAQGQPLRPVTAEKRDDGACDDKRDHAGEALVIRRRQADVSRTIREVTVAVTDRRRTAKGLEEVLHHMQRERGKGLWSDADPEVLVGASLAGRLRQGETIEELVSHVLERVFR